MAVFSVNQATQFYAGRTIKEVIMKDGSSYYEISGTDANGNAFTERTDIIKPGCIISETADGKTVASLQVSARKETLTLTKPTVGEQYIIKLNISNWYNDSCTGNYIKTVAVLATSAMSSATLFGDAVALALNNATAKDLEAPYVATNASGTVTITPKVYHTVGKRFVCPNITATVAVMKDDANVAHIKTSDAKTPAVAITGTGLMKLKDLEFFCAGEKGDRYRGVGYPNDIPFVSRLTDITEASNMKTIHYYETLPNEAVQKSEKTIILVGNITKGANPGGEAQS